jgi:hypothetical protein
LPRSSGTRISVRALEKAGFRITRQSKHIIMTDGTRIVVVSRQDPVDPYTMGDIVNRAGLTIEQSRELLQVRFPPGNPAPRSKNDYQSISVPSPCSFALS